MHLGYIIPVVTAMPRPGRYRLHARTMIKHCHCHRPPCLAMLPNCAGATPLKMFWILYSIKTGARSCSVGQLSISLLTLFWRIWQVFWEVDQWLAMSSAPLGRVLKYNWQEGNLLLAEVQSRHEICQKKLHNQPKQFFDSFTVGVSKSCTSTKIMKENALFSGKIYTAGTNFIQPTVVATFYSKSSSE